ncbi:unnamed protein product [Musa acuminata subsp. burmannicoides]
MDRVGGSNFCRKKHMRFTGWARNEDIIMFGFILELQMRLLSMFLLKMSRLCFGFTHIMFWLLRSIEFGVPSTT